MRSALAGALLALVLGCGAGRGAATARADDLVIANARVITDTRRVVERVAMVVRDGHTARDGSGVTALSTEE